MPPINSLAEVASGRGHQVHRQLSVSAGWLVERRRGGGHLINAETTCNHPAGFVCAKKSVRSLAVQINWGHLHAQIRHCRSKQNSNWVRATKEGAGNQRAQFICSTARRAADGKFATFAIILIHCKLNKSLIKLYYCTLRASCPCKL